MSSLTLDAEALYSDLLRGMRQQLASYPLPPKLVVLVDRGGRELPVQPDLAVARVALPASQSLELARAEDGKFSFQVQG